jgi:hypothetical protein
VLQSPPLRQAAKRCRQFKRTASKKIHMKKNLLFILILLFFSCEKSQKKTVSTKLNYNDPIKIYSWDEYEKIIHKNPKQKIEIIDTICPFETKKAKLDIKKNKLVLYSYQCIEGTLDELNIAIKPYGMIAKEGNKTCTRPPEGFNYFCYEDLMRKEIEDRYGENWIDSIERVAIKNYVIKHPNEPYFEGGKDLRDEYIKK